MLNPKTTLNCGGQLVDISQPVVMGILNTTPDSFYSGSRFQSDRELLLQAGKMMEDGATFIDIGGASSRPGAPQIAPQEELKRVLPAIKTIKKELPEAILSIDTYWSEVVEGAVDHGVQIINDISAGLIDPLLWPVLARLKLPYILMHMQGLPENMQENPRYENVGTEVLDFFILKVRQLIELGVKDLILDPGFGFGKTLEQNFQLLRQMPAFKILDLPILAGLSRKSMICKTLKVNPPAALNGTTALNMLALQNGASILRVHDVKEAVECIQLWTQYEKCQ